MATANWESQLKVRPSTEGNVPTSISQPTNNQNISGLNAVWPRTHGASCTDPICIQCTRTSWITPCSGTRNYNAHVADDAAQPQPNQHTLTVNAVNSASPVATAPLAAVNPGVHHSPTPNSGSRINTSSTQPRSSSGPKCSLLIPLDQLKRLVVVAVIHSWRKKFKTPVCQPLVFTLEPVVGGPALLGCTCPCVAWGIPNGFHPLNPFVACAVLVQSTAPTGTRELHGELLGALSLHLLVQIEWFFVAGGVVF